MQVPSSLDSEPCAGCGPVERAKIALEETRDKETKALFEVLQTIHKTADERGDRIKGYLDETKVWLTDMKEIFKT